MPSSIGKIFLLFILVGGIIILTACSNTSGTSSIQIQNLKADKPAPDFQLENLNGQLVALSDYRGKPVFFNYWASWCPSCIQEMPIIQSVYEDWAKRGLVLLTVNIGEDTETVKNFLQKNQYTFPVLFDTDDTVAKEYGIYYIPVSVFVDKEGKLRSRVVGPFPNKSTLEKQLSIIMSTR